MRKRHRRGAEEVRLGVPGRGGDDRAGERRPIVEGPAGRLGAATVARAQVRDRAVAAPLSRHGIEGSLANGLRSIRFALAGITWPAELTSAA